MTLKYKGIDISYERIGKGPVLVLLHGFLENRSMWSSLITELSKEKTLITIDLLGHGETGCLGYIHTMEMMAEGVLAVLASEQVKRFSIVGHSMGGYVSLAIANTMYGQIKTLCLMNSTTASDSEDRKLIRTRGVQAAKGNYEQVVRLSVGNLFSEDSKDIFSDQIQEVKNEAVKTPLQGYIAAQEGMKVRKDQTAFFKASKFNKMVILGKKDPILDFKTTKEKLQNTDVELITLDGGHMSHIESSLGVFNHLSKI